MRIQLLVVTAAVSIAGFVACSDSPKPPVSPSPPPSPLPTSNSIAGPAEIAPGATAFRDYRALLQAGSFFEWIDLGAGLHQGYEGVLDELDHTLSTLLAALKQWNIAQSKVQILNLAPPAIIAAWKRGDIDATYVWDPALGVAKENGKVLITSGELAQKGAPTFDAWIVRKDFAAKHPEVVKSFAKVTLDAYADYRKDPQAWLADKANVDKLAKLSGAKTSDIPALLQGNVFPLAADQVAALGAPTTQAITETAKFLKEQGKVEAVLPDYAPYVSSQFITN